MPDLWQEKNFAQHYVTVQKNLTFAKQNLRHNLKHNALIHSADSYQSNMTESFARTNLSYKQIPHHLSGGVRHYLTLQVFDP